MSQELIDKIREIQAENRSLLRQVTVRGIVFIALMAIIVAVWMRSQP